MALTPVHRLTRHVGHRLETAAAADPITRDEIRTLLRDPPTAENDFIDLCLAEAVVMFEAATGIAAINQSWKLTLDHWPRGREAWWNGVVEAPISEIYTGRGPNYVSLPRYPLQSITSLTTYDESNSSTSVTVGDYFYVDSASFPGRMVLNNSDAWPTALRNRNAIEIIYVAGFGATASDVPVVIKRAMQSLAAYLWHNRGDGCSSAQALAGSGALNIAAEYVTLRI